MSAVFETTNAELRALLAATWPDTVDNGIWESENLDLIPWEQVTPPIANIAIGTMPVSQDYGFANDIHAGNVTLTWVGATEGDSTNQRAKAEALRDALQTAQFTYANLIDVVSVDWSDTLPVNRVLAEKGMVFRAAVVVASLIVAAKVAA